MRNKWIKIICIVFTIICALYSLYKWIIAKELDFIALLMVIVLPTIVILLPNIIKTNHIHKFDHSSWVQTPDGHYKMIIPFKIHGIENPKAVLYILMNGSLSRINGSIDIGNKNEVIVNVNSITTEGEVRITS